MRAQAFAHEPPPDDVDLKSLDRFLMSDRAPEESMQISDLDGFLTGIAIGPELVMPSEWLPAIFGGEMPEFADIAEANAILGIIMGRYNEILRLIDAGDCDPVFWADRDGTLIAADWAEGFLQAITLRADSWGPLFKSKRQGHLLFPILALCGDETGESLLGLPPEDEDRVMEKATEFVPASVLEIAAYWRSRRRRPQQALLASAADAAGRVKSEAKWETKSIKVNRNGPCPCGSGKKFKKCCGRAA